jgi:hypothetical protein
MKNLHGFLHILQGNLQRKIFLNLAVNRRPKLLVVHQSLSLQSYS